MSNTKKLAKLVRKYKTQKQKPVKKEINLYDDDYLDLEPYIELANSQDRQSDMGGLSKYYWR